MKKKWLQASLEKLPKKPTLLSVIDMTLKYLWQSLISLNVLQYSAAKGHIPDKNK